MHVCERRAGKSREENHLSCSQSSNCPGVLPWFRFPWPSEEISLALLALTLLYPCQLLSIYQAHQTVLGIMHTDVKRHFTEALDVRPGLSLWLAHFTASAVVWGEKKVHRADRLTSLLASLPCQGWKVLQNMKTHAGRDAALTGFQSYLSTLSPHPPTAVRPVSLPPQPQKLV